MLQTLLYKATWLVPATLEAAIAGQMFRRGLWKQYPIFWSYLLSDILRTLVLFAIGDGNAHYSTYFYTYWVSECFACLLGFFVVGEVFRSAFSKRLGLREWGRAIFRVSLLGLVGLALLAARAAPGNDSSKLVAAMLVLKRAESLVRLGLVAALLIFVFILGLPWKSPDIGIAAGFAVHGMVELAALAIRSHYGPAANRTFRWSITGAEFCQGFVWAAYLLRKSHSPPTGGSGPPSHPPDAVSNLASMNEAVGILLER